MEPMADLGFGMVDIIRDFLLAHRLLTEVVARFGEGSLKFSDVQPLVGSDGSAVLFRLKERCHRIFRAGSAGVEQQVRTGELFDLAVGSLFHEAMKLRENLYQQESYSPRVAALRVDTNAEGGELISEFEKILSAAAIRLDEAVQEADVLLQQTRKQLMRLLEEQKANGLTARCLYELAEEVDEAFPDGLDGLYEKVYGSSLGGYMKSVESYLASAYFAEALAVLGAARRHAAMAEDIEGLAAYAEGMQAFLARDYHRSVARLEMWVASGPTAAECERAQLAHSAMSHVENLIEADSNGELIERADRLAKALEPLAEVRH